MKRALAAAVIVLFGSSCAIAGGFSISPIVLVGDPAPGGGAISLIQTGFVRNSAGQLLFTGDENGSVPDGGRQGMWLFDQSGGRLIAQSAFGEPGFRWISIGSTGQVIYSKAEEDGSSIWAGPPEAIRLIAHGNHPAPGPGGPPNYGAYLDAPRINGAGMVSFHQGNEYLASPDNRVIWAGMNGGIAAAAADETAAPGTSTTFFNVWPAVLSESGKLAFYALLNPYDSLQPTEGIWTGKPGAIQLLAKSGMEAPGMPGLNWLGAFYPPSINSAGTVAFAGLVKDPSYSPWHSGIWVGEPGTLKLAVRDGQPAPGTSQTFFQFFGAQINDREEIVFEARLATVFTRGVWVGKPDHLRKIIEEGAAVPGEREGVTFSHILSQFLINNQGQVAFEGFLEGIEPDDRWTRAIFFADEGQEARAVVRNGDWLEVRGVQRQINELFMQAGDDERLGEDGSFAFFAAFTDGTRGIFVAKVPEPSVGMFLLVLLAGLARRRSGGARRGGICLSRETR